MRGRVGQSTTLTGVPRGVILGLTKFRICSDLKIRILTFQDEFLHRNLNLVDADFSLKLLNKKNGRMAKFLPHKTRPQGTLERGTEKIFNSGRFLCQKTSKSAKSGGCVQKVVNFTQNFIFNLVNLEFWKLIFIFSIRSLLKLRKMIRF